MKKATKFFENMGEKIIEFNDEAGKFAQNSAKVSYKYLREKALDSLAVVNNIGQEIENYGSQLSSSSIKAYNDALSKAKGTLQRTSNLYKSVKDHGERTLFLAGKALWKWVSKEAKLEYLEDLGPKVKKYYKKIYEEAEKKYEEAKKKVNVHQ